MDADLNFLGILNRGGKLHIGPDCLHAKKGALLLLASDCSNNSKKQFLSFAASRNIPVKEIHTKSELGECLGYQELSGILIGDSRAAKAYLAKLPNPK